MIELFMVRKAKFGDYVDIQGGSPEVVQDKNGLWHITHLYREDAPEIVTHISPTQRGTVVLKDKNGKPVEFQVSRLWQFEGQPCEENSRKTGGEGYNRGGAVGRRK